MRKFLLMAAVATAGVAVAFTGDLFTSFSSALGAADSLRAKYTVQPVGGAPATYSVVLQKPNKARLDTPAKTIVADGQSILTFDKAERQYAKRPQTESDFKTLFSPEELSVWAGFFDPSMNKPLSTKEKGQINVGGSKLTGVEAVYDNVGRRIVTYYIDPGSSLLRQAKIDLATAGGKNTSILATQEVALGDLPEGAFVFNPPANSKEVKWEEMDAMKWLTNLEEAKALAKSTGKKIFVDFMADWCGPCKKLEAEVFQQPGFRKYTAKVVLLKIDVDRQKSVAQAYRIEAMPTQMVLDANGNVLAQTVGYANPASFYQFLDGALR